jgi:hypothetical protein
MVLRSLLVVLACLSLAFVATPAQAAQVQLAWDAPVQDDGRIQALLRLAKRPISDNNSARPDDNVYRHE